MILFESIGVKMKIVNRIITYVFFFMFVLVLFNITKPYWNRYWLERHLETAAVFGTKHSLDETRDLLMSKMREEGYGFKEEDFVINKDEKNRVSINIIYTDEIEIFKKPLKQILLTAEGSAREVESYY
jgi:hypothetical protein